MEAFNKYFPLFFVIIAAAILLYGISNELAKPTIKPYETYVTPKGDTIIVYQVDMPYIHVIGNTTKVIHVNDFKHYKLIKK